MSASSRRFMGSSRDLPPPPWQPAISTKRPKTGSPQHNGLRLFLKSPLFKKHPRPSQKSNSVKTDAKILIRLTSLRVIAIDVQISAQTNYSQTVLPTPCEKSARVPPHSSCTPQDRQTDSSR